MEYTVVEGGDEPADLAASVNELLKSGWRTAGGVAFEPKYGYCYQAMTRDSTATSARGGSRRKKSTQQNRKTRHRRKRSNKIFNTRELKKSM